MSTGSVILLDAAIVIFVLVCVQVHTTRKVNAWRRRRSQENALRTIRGYPPPARQ